MTRVTVRVELDDVEALALAQFCKRISWSECRQNSVDDSEAYLQRDALDKVRQELAEMGYAPR